MDSRTIIVHAVWDADAGVFVATSSDVPGLVAEAATLDRLEEKLSTLVPEMLELNRPASLSEHYDNFVEVPLIVRSELRSKVRVHV